MADQEAQHGGTTPVLNTYKPIIVYVLWRLLGGLFIFGFGAVYWIQWSISTSLSGFKTAIDTANLSVIAVAKQTRDTKTDIVKQLEQVEKRLVAIVNEKEKSLNTRLASLEANINKRFDKTEQLFKKTNYEIKNQNDNLRKDLGALVVSQLLQGRTPAQAYAAKPFSLIYSEILRASLRNKNRFHFDQLGSGLLSVVSENKKIDFKKFISQNSEYSIVGSKLNSSAFGKKLIPRMIVLVDNKTFAEVKSRVHREQLNQKELYWYKLFVRVDPDRQLLTIPLTNYDSVDWASKKLFRNCIDELVPFTEHPKPGTVLISRFENPKSKIVSYYCTNGVAAVNSPNLTECYTLGGKNARKITRILKLKKDAVVFSEGFVGCPVQMQTLEEVIHAKQNKK